MVNILKDSQGFLQQLKLTRGDTTSFIVEIYNPTDNSPYSFKAGDSIKLFIKRLYTDQNTVLTTTGTPVLNTAVATFQFSGTDTLNIPWGEYIL